MSKAKTSVTKMSKVVTVVIILSTIVVLGFIVATNTYPNCQSRTTAVLSGNNEANSKDLIISLDVGNFNTTVAKGVTLVDFWAPWCQPCLIQGPILEKLARSFEKKVKIAKVNVEKYPSLANILQVRSIPTLLFFYDGKEVNRFIGVQSKNSLLEAINHLLVSEES